EVPQAMGPAPGSRYSLGPLAVPAPAPHQFRPGSGRLRPPCLLPLRPPLAGPDGHQGPKSLIDLLPSTPKHQCMPAIFGIDCLHISAGPSYASWLNPAAPPRRATTPKGGTPWLLQQCRPIVIPLFQCSEDKPPSTSSSPGRARSMNGPTNTSTTSPKRTNKPFTTRQR